MTSQQEKQELALPLLRYFTQTYGMRAWVLDLNNFKEGRRGWVMDFSTYDHSPSYAQAIPEHERPWFRVACCHDYWASYAEEKGTKFVIFEDPDWGPVAVDDLPKVLL